LLAQETEARIDAVDLLQPLINRLGASVTKLSLEERVFPQLADMNCLPFEPNSFQLIWSEGAIYQMGFEAGLRAWHPLLVPGGQLVVSELTWLVDDPPKECRDYWSREYPAICNVQSNLRMALAAGYSLVSHFTLPRQSWLAGYHDLLAENLDRIEQNDLENDHLMAELVAASREEIELFSKYGDTFGYVFYILRAT